MTRIPWSTPWQPCRTAKAHTDFQSVELPTAPDTRWTVVDDLITVTWAGSGRGTIALASHTPQGEVKIGEVLHGYNGKYVFVSKEALGDVRFTFTAPGSLPPETQFRVAMAGFSLMERPNDNTTATVSGSGAPEIAREATMVTATVKTPLERGNTVTITIKGLVAPEIMATDVPPSVTVYVYGDNGGGYRK